MSKLLDSLIEEHRHCKIRISAEKKLRSYLRKKIEEEIAKEFDLKQVIVSSIHKCEKSPIKYHVTNPNAANWESCIYCGDK